MTGRAIDQLLPHPGDPTLRESVVSDARTYIRLAEQTNGPIPAPVDFAWPWGEALDIVDKFVPDVRLINLETSITACREFARGKAVHDRMHPDNVGIRGAGAGLDAKQAERPAVVGLADGTRVVIASCGMGSSGSPHGWAAT